MKLRAIHQGPKDVEARFGELMKSLANGWYDDFVSDGDPNFQASITPQMVRAVQAQLVPRITEGASSSYMGELDRKAYRSHYWKLSFEDGAGDRLVRLSVKSGKIHAFYIL